MKLFKYTSILFSVIAAMTFVACSSDDDDDIKDAPFASEAVKMQIENSNEYSTIELTESGNYIVVKKGANKAKSRLAAKADYSSLLSPFLHKQLSPITRSDYGDDNVLYGKYTKNADGSYNLDGFGTLVINGSGSNKTLVLTKTDGETVELKASVIPQTQSSGMTKKLCRRWKFNGVRSYCKINGKTIYDIKASTYKELRKKVDEAEGYDHEYEEDEEDPEPLYVTFTQSGTYMVIYDNDLYYIAFWKWSENVKDAFVFSETPEFDEYDEEEPAKVEFSGNKCTVYSIYKKEYDSQTYEYGAYDYLIAD